MIWDSLKNVMSKYSRETNRFYVRNLLKEVLQFYVLNFVYSKNEYKDLIFTGGTCLRRCYNLPRLSEDLDFNYETEIDFEKFLASLQKYFKEDLQFPYASIKIRPEFRSVFLTFGVLTELGFAQNRAESNNLSLRLDFRFNSSKIFKTEESGISGEDFTLVAKHYDLPTLFANKINALLERVYKKSPTQTEPFKGRDVFDLAWFIEQNKKTGLKPNFERLTDVGIMITKEGLLKDLLAKIEKVENEALKIDLLPFFPTGSHVDAFCENYKSIIKNNLRGVIS